MRRARAFLGSKPPVRLLLVGQTSCLWSAGDTAFPPRATVLLRTPDPAPRRCQERRGSPLVSCSAAVQQARPSACRGSTSTRGANDQPEFQRDRFRPDPIVSGPGAAGLLALAPARPALLQRHTNSIVSSPPWRAPPLSPTRSQTGRAGGRQGSRQQAVRRAGQVLTDPPTYGGFTVTAACPEGPFRRATPALVDHPGGSRWT